MLQLPITLVIRISIREEEGRESSLKAQPLKIIQLIDTDRIDPLFLTNSSTQIWSFCAFPLAGKAR